MPDSETTVPRDSGLADVAPTMAPAAPSATSEAPDGTPQTPQPAVADRTSRRHAVNMRSLALAAIGLRGCPADATDDEPPELRFLREYLDVTSVRGGWRGAVRRYVRRPKQADAPLVRLADGLGLSTLELLTVALALAVEEDLMVGRALARIQSPIGGSRPTVGLVLASFGEVVARGVRPIDELLAGPAIASGLLTLLAEGAPLPERAVSIPGHLCLALRGQDGALAGTTIGLGDTPEVRLGPSILADAERHARGLESDGHRALVVRTGSVAEGRSAAAAIARAMRRRPLFIEGERAPALAPWLLLRELVPVYSLELAPGERKTLPSMPGYAGPVIAIAGPDGGVDSTGGAVLSWSIQVPPRAEREQLWRDALGDGDLPMILARDHRHGCGRIAHLGRLVRHRLATAGRDVPTAEDVAIVSWAGEGGGLDALAQPLTERIPDEALVMPPSLRRELETLLLRCRGRDELVVGLGASAAARFHPGVRALFAGASGTGKTLAAGWLATKLALPLYRVDLASVTSKYIGETEKNLAQLLARAEQAEVVLLFDEADSLFGKRTDVKDSNDRFANAQTNYLLQRIETYDGIALLTSNSRGRFDAGFSRRLDAVVEFPLPGPEERRDIWLSHLGTDASSAGRPSAHTLEMRQINQLAARVDFAGGQIRNAVLTAAVLARSESRPITYADVLEGLSSEYQKLGRQMPAELRPSG